LKLSRWYAEAPKISTSVMTSRWAALSGNTSLIAIFSSYVMVESEAM